jgi:hypothetical protein
MVGALRSASVAYFSHFCQSNPWFSDCRNVSPNFPGYSSRWRTFIVFIPPTLLPCLQVQPDRLPLLEQLRINIRRNTARILAEDVLKFPPSPRLNSIEIRNIPLSKVEIQWHTVTHVSAQRLDIRDCLELLRVVPKLDDCEFHNVIDNIPFPESPILSPLEFLSLSCDRGYTRLLNNMVLPSLGSLALLDIYHVKPLMAFFKRSACPLHTLSLHWDASFDDLMELLQLVSPSLKILVICGYSSCSNDYLSILAKTYSSQNAVAGNDFLPYLKIFGYKEVSELPDGLPSPKIFNLPDSIYGNYPKLTKPIPLRSAYVDLRSMPEPISQDTLSTLRQLNKDGILNTPSTGLLDVILSETSLVE